MTLMAASIQSESKKSTDELDYVDDYYPSTAHDYSIYQFGFSESAAIVTVTAGEVQWGKTTITVSSTPVTILANDTYIGVECDGTTANLISDTDISIMRSDDDKLRTWLHKWSLDADGNAYCVAIGHLGNIINPSTYTVP